MKKCCKSRIARKQIVSVLLLVVLFANVGWSQSKKEIRKMKKRMWDNNDFAFAITKIPLLSKKVIK